MAKAKWLQKDGLALCLDHFENDKNRNIQIANRKQGEIEQQEVEKDVLRSGLKKC